MIKVSGMALGLLMLVAPAAVAVQWVVLGEDNAKQVLLDWDSVQVRNGTATFTQRVRSKPKAPALTPQGTRRIDSRIEANCYSKLYRVLNYTAYGQSGKIVERSRVPSGNQVAAYNSPDYLAIAEVCE